MKFSQKILRIGDFEKLSFFELAILDFFFIPMKIGQSFLGIKDGYPPKHFSRQCIKKSFQGGNMNQNMHG